MTEPELAVDTIRLRGRVRDADAVRVMGSATIRQTTDPATGEMRTEAVAGIDTLRSGARVGMDKLNAGGWEAWIEYSAPKIATGSNVIALPLREAIEVSEQVYAEAGEVVTWMEHFEHMRVQRIDPDRDFEGVEHQVPLLTGLSKLRAAYNPKTRLFPDPTKAGAMTLTRGPATRWQSTLYSKEGEAAHRLRYAQPEHRDQLARDLETAKGRLRFEARLRSDVLAPAGIRTIADLTVEKLAGQRRKYFNRVGYGMEVAGMQVAVAKVAGSGLTVPQQVAVLGYMLLESQGVGVDVGRTTTWTTAVRLDYDTGTTIAA
jgi:hypothetical protein